VTTKEQKGPRKGKIQERSGPQETQENLHRHRPGTNRAKSELKRGGGEGTKKRRENKVWDPVGGGGVPSKQREKKRTGRRRKKIYREKLTTENQEKAKTRGGKTKLKRGSGWTNWGRECLAGKSLGGNSRFMDLGRF